MGLSEELKGRIKKAYPELSDLVEQNKPVLGRILCDSRRDTLTFSEILACKSIEMLKKKVADEQEKAHLYLDWIGEQKGGF